MPAAPLSERLMRTSIRALGALPERLQRMIAGAPVEIDGQRLYTEVQMALRVLNALPGPGFEDLPLAQARAQIDAENRAARELAELLRLAIGQDLAKRS